MPNTALQEQIAAARAYEGLHVPALFGAWAEPVLDAAEISPGQRVLDVACGTGVLARAALERVGTSGSVVGVDPNPGMLAVAAELSGDAEWRAGTAEELPFPDASFDAVVSQFGLMFFSDPCGAAREMGRVLRPGGALAVAVWDALGNSPAYALEVELLDRLAGPAAGDALRAPFARGDSGELTALFENAGLSSVEIVTRTGRARFPDVRVMVEADLRGWLPVMGIELSDEKIEEILAEAESVLAPFVTEDGRIEFDQPAHIVVWRSVGDGEDAAR